MLKRFKTVAGRLSKATYLADWLSLETIFLPPLSLGKDEDLKELKLKSLEYYAEGNSLSTA